MTREQPLLSEDEIILIVYQMALRDGRNPSIERLREVYRTCVLRSLRTTTRRRQRARTTQHRTLSRTR